MEYFNKRKDKKKRFFQQLGAIMAIFGFVFALVFLTANITGNVVSEISKTGSNIFSAVFFVIGVIGVFLFIKNREERYPY